MKVAVKNTDAQPMHNACTIHARRARGFIAGGAALLTLSALSACSPGSVVAGTIGAAGAVAGTAVDVVLRNDVSHEVIE